MKLTLRFLFAVFISAVCMSAKYQGPKEDVAKSSRLDRFSCSIAKKYNMEFLVIGNKWIVDDNYNNWSILFSNRNRMTIEQARPLVKNIICEFIAEIKTQPVYRQWVIFMTKRDSKWDADINPGRLGIKIGFWDENMDRPLAPYLAQILVVNRVVKYYYADPNTQALQEPPIEETFEQLGIPDFQFSLCNGKWVEG